VLAAFTVAIFVGAALLFFVQPMVAKMLLPLLGGSPAVWNTCMVFFQAALLAGYAYAHWSVRFLGPRRQSVLHFVIVLAPLLVLPVVLRGGDPPAEGSPVGWLLFALAATIGLPFVVAATGGPLLQRWFAATGHKSAADPYFLYAASNAGSLLALLAYPVLVEPMTTVGQQQWLWSGGYVLFAMLTIVCGVLVLRSAGGGAVAMAAPVPAPAAAAPETPASPAAPGVIKPVAMSPWRQRAWWLAMAFIPSSLMLGVTQYMSTDIAAVPLLWIVPLSIYLLTFILAFSGRPIFSVRLLSRILPVLVIALAVAFLTRATTPILVLIPLHLVTFFIAALLCHLRLAESRPPTTRLTEFYLLIAVGGVLGGIFNALIAPVVFTAVAEYPIAIALACLARTPSISWERKPRWMAPALDYGAPVVIGVLAFYGAWLGHHIERGLKEIALSDLDAQLILGVGVPAFACYLLATRRIGLALGIGALFTVALLKAASAGGVIYNERTFYGVHRVKFNAPFVELVHSNTAHGVQARDPVGRFVPLAYYSPQSPIGHVFEQFHSTELFSRVGIVGLGAGTIAAYGQPGQQFTFHEIDPAIVNIARTHFTYLEDTKAQWDVKLGDGRQTLARMVQDGEYGLLVLDAFSSDAIPVHLVTREAVQMYAQKLRPGGILAFHISNRYLNLLPVLERIAEDRGLALIHRNDPIDEVTSGRTGTFGSHWVLLARDRYDFGPLLRDVRWVGPTPGRRGPLWTDDYSNIVSIFTFGQH
jgi:SAM-dependent methyltransferase